MGGGRSEGGEEHLHLFLLGAGGEEGGAGVDFEDEAAETPDVDLVVVGLHEDDFRGAVVPALDVGKLLLVEEAGRAEVDQLHPRLPQLLKYHIFRLDIAMDYIFLHRLGSYTMEKEQRLHELYENLADDVKVEALVVLCFDVGVDVHAKHLRDDTLL